MSTDQARLSFNHPRHYCYRTLCMIGIPEGRANRMKITLYRGISVDADLVSEVCDQICSNGILEREPLAIQYIGLKHARLPSIRTLTPDHIELREEDRK